MGPEKDIKPSKQPFRPILRMSTFSDQNLDILFTISRNVMDLQQAEARQRLVDIRNGPGTQQFYARS